MDRPEPGLPVQPYRKGVRLSIVIPVYRGEATIDRLVRTLVEAFGSVYRLEIVLVNDGSPDGSASVCRALAHAFPCVTFLNLSRNFSEHNAVMAGLNHTTGDHVVIMDDDFQNPPEEVVKLVNEIDRGGYDVVYSSYTQKKHHWARNLGSGFNNLVASVLISKPRDLYLSSFKVISRFVVDELIQYRGPYPYIDGLILRFTRNYSCVQVRHDDRPEGQSSYTLRKLVALWLNMFTNFSILPLRLASMLGLLLSVTGVVMAAGFVVEKLVDPDLPSGWASLIVSLFLIGGVQLFALGMIGEYLGRLFLKDNGRPQFVIREVVRGQALPDALERVTTRGAVRTATNEAVAGVGAASKDTASEDAAQSQACDGCTACADGGPCSGGATCRSDASVNPRPDHPAVPPPEDPA
jgi:glycosyltransferase involved in cell wall biosynthesis